MAAGSHLRRTPVRHGFTLIELLVVIAIIAILASILTPAVQDALDRGRQAGCLCQMRTLSIGHLSYALENDGHIFAPDQLLSEDGSRDGRVIPETSTLVVGGYAGIGHFICPADGKVRRKPPYPWGDSRPIHVKPVP